LISIYCSIIGVAAGARVHRNSVRIHHARPRLISAVPITAMAAPAQAAAIGAMPERNHTIGKIMIGVIEESVVTMPTLPVANAAINRLMPNPVPKKDETTAMLRSPLRNL
jgi:hypothetical protein